MTEAEKRKRMERERLLHELMAGGYPIRQEQQPSLHVGLVVQAMAEIKRGTSRRLKPSFEREDDDDLNLDNWVEVQKPPDKAVRVLTQALQAGDKAMIKRALDLRPSTQAKLVAKEIAFELTHLKKGISVADIKEHGDPENWEFPVKDDIWRRLRDEYPALAETVTQKEDRPRSRWWADCGLSGLEQSRGY